MGDAWENGYQTWKGKIWKKTDKSISVINAILLICIWASNRGQQIHYVRIVQGNKKQKKKRVLKSR